MTEHIHRGLSNAPSGHQEKQAMHTPGPWSAHHTRISWWIEAPSDRSRFISGPIPAHIWHLEPRERENCEALRNARLIAAAPDLLEALEALLATHKPGRGQCCAAADKAIDAIAKARPHD